MNVWNQWTKKTYEVLNFIIFSVDKPAVMYIHQGSFVHVHKTGLYYLYLKEIHPFSVEPDYIHLMSDATLRRTIRQRHLKPFIVVLSESTVEV